MASGLQCPGCGHVHPAGLPEIARGDSTFRCYGCYRTLSVPDGWTGRATPRPAAPPAPPADAPPGAGTRDARSARLAGRRGFWPSARAADPTRSPADDAGPATELVPIAVGGPAPGPPSPGSVPTLEPGRPLGRVAPRRSVKPLPAALRALIWALAFSVAFAVAAFVLKEIGLLGVNNVIDLYAGSGLHRFGILLALLPIWALLAATLAHFAIEAVTARRSRQSAPVPKTSNSTPA